MLIAYQRLQLAAASDAVHDMLSSTSMWYDIWHDMAWYLHWHESKEEPTIAAICIRIDHLLTWSLGHYCVVKANL